MPTRDLYESLEVDRNAGKDEVKAAYRRRAKTCHPDAGGDRAEFEEIKLAAGVLLDAHRRRLYDETGKVEEPKADLVLQEAIGCIDQILSPVLANLDAPLDNVDLVMLV